MGLNRAPSLYQRLSALAARRRGRATDTADGSPAADAPELADAPVAGQRPAGLVLWCHAQSAEDLAPVEALVPRLAAMLGEPVATVATAPAGALQSARSIRPETIFQPAPSGFPAGAERFLSHWRPDLGVVSGPGLPEALLRAAGARGIPLFWVNAVCKRPASRWRPWTADAPFHAFTRVFPMSRRDAEELRQSGVAPELIDFRGPVQEAPLALPCDETERDAIARKLASRPVWLATAVGDASAQAVSDAHRHASRMSHRLLLVAVPDAADGGPALARRFEDDGWTVGLRSAGDRPMSETQVFVADVAGEMGLWYRLAPITFAAATLDPDGDGPNPFDPAALGSAVVHGPHAGAHAARFDRLALAGASRPVASGEELGPTISELLAPDRTAALAEAAWRVTSNGAEAADRVLDALATALDGGGAGT